MAFQFGILSNSEVIEPFVALAQVWKLSAIACSVPEALQNKGSTSAVINYLELSFPAKIGD